MADADIAPVADYSPSIKLVYLFLRRGDGSATIADLVDRTGLSRSQVSRALTELEGEGLIDREPTFGAGARYRYTVA